MQQYYYLVHIQYLGFRFHGWQKQPELKTVHFMVDKTLAFVFGHTKFKTMGTSRTDAKVSASHSAFELFLEEPIDEAWFLRTFNSNLPSDIRGIKIEQVDADFNIINTAKTKEYHYLFTFGEKPHPFSASMITYIEDTLDIEKMMHAAPLFEGTHYFKRYCTKPKPNTSLTRTIDHCRIEPNTTYTANFFPTQSYLLKIRSNGFLRYQVRLIMAELFNVGRGIIDENTIRTYLSEAEDPPAMDSIAPGSGLILHKIDFEI